MEFNRLQATEEKIPLSTCNEGQTAAWIIRWLLENNIEGFGRWCFGRYWVSNIVDDFETEGYSRNLVTRSIINLKKETDCNYYDRGSISAWLEEHKEIPELSAELPISPKTSQVVASIIVPATKYAKITYSALIDSQHKGIATHFVSHSWSYPIWSLVEGIVMHQLESNRGILYTLSLNKILGLLDSLPNPNYYWLDIFNKNQHVVNGENTATELADCIKLSKRTVLILHPDERWALGRIWCLFEVLNTIQHQAKLEIGLSFRFVDLIEDERIQDKVKEENGGIVDGRPSWSDLERYQHFQSIDVRTAEATVPSDKEMIFKEIVSTIGFDKMNKIVLDSIIESFAVVQKGLYL